MQSNWYRWTLLCLLTLAVGCTKSTDVTEKVTDGEDAVELLTTTPSNRVARDDEGTELKNKEIVPLSIGDKAPPLKIASWIKGEPIQGYEADHITVVEFWATWCGPCKVSMPHISELQQAHADSITFVGVTDEPDSTVQAFLDTDQSDDRTWDDVVRYRLASEGEDRPMWKSFMAAASQSGIPTAFIVGRDGIIEWIGHPMGIDEPIQQLVDGTWDRQLFQVQFERKQAENRAINAARPELSSARRAKEWDTVVAVLEKLEKEIGLKPIGSMKASLLMEAERFEECQNCLRETAELSWDESSKLNTLAWMAATEIPPANRDLEWALTVATRADQLAAGEDGMILDTVARIYFEMGDIEEAIAWQRRAVDQMPGEKTLTKALDTYLQAQQGDANANENSDTAMEADVSEESPASEGSVEEDASDDGSSEEAADGE